MRILSIVLYAPNYLDYEISANRGVILAGLVKT